MTKVRTRFAPSPTGFMHVGGIRTALFGWLLARHGGGQFVLRIEDTDKEREVEGSVDHILDSLNWLGLDRDEGPAKGGAYGPYRQSERLETYKAFAQQLIEAGLAYADPFSPEQVAEFRDQAKANKQPFLFRNFRPSETNTPDNWYGHVPIRFKTMDPSRTTWYDEVRGELSAGEEALDDFVIIKADGYPTYNFAHVIDDYDMQITHIIRGEEFIPSTPKFISLHQALGFELPKFVTVPPILNANGGKKLSKRDGAKDVLEYHDEGYTPEAVLNFLASLGWNDGTEDEVFTPDELVKRFSIERIQKSGAKFDETKLDWYQWQHTLRSIETNPAELLESQGQNGDDINPAFAKLAATKARSLDDFMHQYQIYTNEPTFSINNFDLSQIDSSLDIELAKQYMEAATQSLASLSDFDEASIEQALRNTMNDLDASPRAFLNLVRWAISGQKVSPNLFAMVAIIGQEQSLQRLENACT